MKRVIAITLFLQLCLTGITMAQSKKQLQVPGKALYTKINVNGVSVLPSGRLLKPAGKVSQITNSPFGLTVSRDGKYGVALHDGVLTVCLLQNDSFIRVPDYKHTIPSPFKSGSL